MTETPESLRELARQCLQFASYHDQEGRKGLHRMALDFALRAELLERALELPRANLGRTADPT